MASGPATGKSLKRANGASLPARVAADRVIAKLRDAEKALAFATTIHQAKLVADVAHAQEVFAHRQRLGKEVTARAHEIETYALAKLGELLAAMPKATGGQPYQKSTCSTKGQVETYTELGIDRKTAAIAQQLAALPVTVRDAIAKQEITLNQARRGAPGPVPTGDQWADLLGAEKLIAANRKYRRDHPAEFVADEVFDALVMLDDQTDRTWLSAVTLGTHTESEWRGVVKRCAEIIRGLEARFV